MKAARSALGLMWLVLLLMTGGHARVVQEVPSEEYFMNYKQVRDCDNPMVDGTCPRLGGPYRLPNLFLAMNGTVFTESDYQVQSTSGYVPPPRAFHASTSFQNLLWITGGRTTPRGNYNTRLTDRLGDVWYSEDGDLWTQVVRLTGDFGVQESDAVQPGPYAPWWSRYGHTLTTLDVNNDGEDDMMVLMGGFAPEPMNDVWVTYTDTAHCKPTIKVSAKLSRPKMAGTGGCQQEWKFVHYADWAPRGWHQAAVFMGRLFVLGGSPLTNDVWSANITNATGSRYSGTADSKLNAGGIWFDWQRHTPLNDSKTNVPYVWSPRAGHVAMVQNRPKGLGEALYVMSGFGGWPCERYSNNYAVRSGCHPHFDGGARARNDVWMTTDATNWTLITKAAAWGARAWAAGTTWHQPGNSSRDVSRYGVVNKLAPKMWLSGGVYYGTKFRALAEKAYSVDTAIDARTAYLDLWWSRDGITWNQSSFKTGVHRNQDDFSTMEPYLTNVQDQHMYLGKYGHSLTPFKRIALDLEEQPALFFICGDRVPQTKAVTAVTSPSASYSSDVFRTALGSDSEGGRTGLLCNTGAFECSDHGTCCHAFGNNGSSTGALDFAVDCSDRDFGGCVCDDGFTGEYCENLAPVAAGRRQRGAAPWLDATFALVTTSFVVVLTTVLPQ